MTTANTTRAHGKADGDNMCEFAIHDKPYPGMIMCGPLNKLCTMCFMGNFNQYEECCEVIENQHYHGGKCEVKE